MPRKPRSEPYFKTSIDIPVRVHEAVKTAAAHNGRSTNEEVIARLSAPEDERLSGLERELQEIKGMLRKLLDAAG